MPPPDLPPPSDAELELLKRLWDLGPCTVRELHDDLENSGLGWAYTTVQTMLGRMEEKGYATVDRDGFAHVFAAAMTRDSLVGMQLHELMAKLCDGAAAPLLLHLAESQRFTAAEIAKFRSLLDAAEQRDDKRGRR